MAGGVASKIERTKMLPDKVSLVPELEINGFAKPIIYHIKHAIVDNIWTPAEGCRTGHLPLKDG